MSEKTPREIYETLQNGDSLTDADLDKGIEHFSNLSKRAAEAGPVFRLAGIEAMRVTMTLESYRDARKRNRK